MLSLCNNKDLIDGRNTKSELLAKQDEEQETTGKEKQRYRATLVPKEWPACEGSDRESRKVAREMLLFLSPLYFRL